MALAGSVLTRGLSSALIGDGADSGGAHASAEGEPLQTQNTAEANRGRVQESQRILADQMVQYSLPLFAVAAFLFMLLFIASAVLYVWGWIVMSKYSGKPCDEPLRWWLITMLCLPMVQCFINQTTLQEQRPKRCQALLAPLCTCAGAWMLLHSKTCDESAPELYSYAKLYILCHVVVSVSSLAISCCFVSVVFWMHRHGLLDVGPGPAFAARPGLIDELETVSFHPDLVRDKVDDQPPECSICTEPFEIGKPVKRTPCGHLFHEQCLGEWLEKYAKTCPLCRKDLQQALDDPEKDDEPP